MSKLITLDNLELFLTKFRAEVEATIEEKISAMQASNTEVEDFFEETGETGSSESGTGSNPL